MVSLSKFFSTSGLFALLLLSSHSAYANTCLDLFNTQPSRIRESTVERVVLTAFESADGKSKWVRIHHKTLKDERGKPILMFEAQLNKASGKMNLAVLTRNEETKEHYDPEVFAQSLFWMAVKSFGAENINIIVGDWVMGKNKFYDPSLPYSTNTGIYYANLGKGMSTTEAALDTWIGRLAILLGLKKAELMGIEDTPYRRSLIVHFTRQ